MLRYPWFLAILVALGGCFLTVAQARQATLPYVAIRELLQVI